MRRFRGYILDPHSVSTTSAVPYRHFPIDEMPNLKLRLGKARVDRIRYNTHHTYPRPVSPRNTPNPVLGFMQNCKAYDGGPVDDIIMGIARLDHHSRSGGVSIPLSVTRLYNILQCMEVINTREVMTMMGIEVRQAQKYIKAVKLIMFHINRHLALTSTSEAV